MKKFILFLSCSIAISVFSQPLTVEAYRDMSLQELMEIKVVSACQVEQMATEAPATVYVITHQQIKERNYTCLRDVLSQIPQIEIQRKVHSQHTDIYTINGVTGNEKFLILMDGIRVNSTTGTEHTLGESYSLGNVQRVEVILGPASALYGADAFTGIINIITNTGYENKGLSLTSEGGMYNTIANTLVYGVGNEDISFAFTGKQYHSDEPFFPTYYPKEYEWYTHYAQTGEMLSFKDTVSTGAIQPWATPTDAYSLIGRLNVKAFEFGYSRLQESHSTSFGNLPSTHIHSSDALYANHIQNIYGMHRYTSSTEKLSVKTIVSAQEFKVHPHSVYQNKYAGFNKAYKYERNRTAKIEEQLHYSLSDKSQFVGGVSYEYANAIPKTNDLPLPFNEDKQVSEQYIYYTGTNVVDSSGKDLTLIQDMYQITYSSFGSYLQWQYDISNYLHLTAGTRYDYNSRYKSTLNPRVGLVYHLSDKLTWKVMHGQAFLAPSPYKAYEQFGAIYPVYNTSNQIVGLESGFLRQPNPDLKPERLTSEEVDVTFHMNTHMALSVNGYYTVIKDLINGKNVKNQYYKTVAVLSLSTPVNAGTTQAYGGTCRFDYKGEIGSSLTSYLYVAYSFTDGNIDGKPLIFSSKHTVKSSVGLSSKRFSSFVDITYRFGSHWKNSTLKSPFSTSPYTLINLEANYKLVEKTPYLLQALFRVQNVLNTRYYHPGYVDMLAVPQDPIRVEVGLRVEIK